MRKLQAIPGKARHHFPSGIAQKVKKTIPGKLRRGFPQAKREALLPRIA
ncbi:hypothetical protein [Rhizobium sp. N122]|nr:hypothetical protein [Rhizobium sp. N122]